MRFIVGLSVLMIAMFAATTGQALELGFQSRFPSAGILGSGPRLGADLTLGLNLDGLRLFELENRFLKTTEPPEVDEESDEDSEWLAHSAKWTKMRKIGRILSWSGTGVLFVGLVTGGVALKKDKAIKDNCPFGECSTEYRDDLASRDATALTADVLLGIGGALLVAGIVTLVIVGRNTKQDSGSRHKSFDEPNFGQ